MKVVLLLLLCHSAYLLDAQIFFSGMILQEDGKEISCSLTYNPYLDGDLLTAKVNGATHYLGSKEVKYFSYYDSSSRTYKSFYSLPYDNGENTVFFEMIYESKRISILSRWEEKEKRRDLSLFLSTLGMLRRGRIVHPGVQLSKALEYYLLDYRENKILNHSKTELLRMTADRGYEIRRFIKKQKISLKDIVDYIRVIDYYNELKTKP